MIKNRSFKLSEIPKYNSPKKYPMESNIETRKNSPTKFISIYLLKETLVIPATVKTPTAKPSPRVNLEKINILS